MNNLQFSKREELSARFATALISVYHDAVNEYDTPQDLIKCWAETSVEMADALMKQWDKDKERVEYVDD